MSTIWFLFYWLIRLWLNFPNGYTKIARINENLVHFLNVNSHSSYSSFLSYEFFFLYNRKILILSIHTLFYENYWTFLKNCLFLFITQFDALVFFINQQIGFQYFLFSWKFERAIKVRDAFVWWWVSVFFYSIYFFI